MKMKSPRNLILAIIVMSLVASISYSFWHRIVPVVDAQAYDNIAVNLVAGVGFKESSVTSYEFDTSIVRAGPGYEFFLAGIYKIFGHHYEAVWLVQAVLHASSAYLLFLICRLVFKKNRHKDWIAIATAALYGLHPDLIEISAMLMTETVYLFFVILTLYFFVRAYLLPKSFGWAISLGIVTGVAVLTRPPVLLFVPIFLFFYWHQKSYTQLLAFLLSTVVVLLPWSVRNYLIYDQLILTTMIGQYNLWIGNILTANGGQIAGGHNPLTEYATLEGFYHLKEKAGFEFYYIVINYPLHVLKLSAIRFVRYFSLIRPMGFWFYQTGLSQAVFIFSSLIGIAVLFISGFSGMILLLKKKKMLFNYLIALSATAPLLLIPTVVQSRYRFQIYPFLAIFGGFFLVSLFFRAKRQKKILAAVCLFFLVISFIDILLFWPTIGERLSMFF